jgi:hypothetical protein
MNIGSRTTFIAEFRSARGARTLACRVYLVGGRPRERLNRKRHLDAKTFLPVKSAGTRKQQDHEIAYESFPGTSNLLNGVMMPFSLNQKMNGRSMLELTVVKVGVNTPMDDSISQIPEPPSPKK